MRAVLVTAAVAALVCGGPATAQIVNIPARVALLGTPASGPALSFHTELGGRNNSAVTSVTTTASGNPIKGTDVVVIGADIGGGTTDHLIQCPASFTQYGPAHTSVSFESSYVWCTGLGSVVGTGGAYTLTWTSSADVSGYNWYMWVFKGTSGVDATGTGINGQGFSSNAKTAPDTTRVTGVANASLASFFLRSGTFTDYGAPTENPTAPVLYSQTCTISGSTNDFVAIARAYLEPRFTLGAPVQRTSTNSNGGTCTANNGDGGAGFSLSLKP